MRTTTQLPKATSGFEPRSLRSDYKSNELDPLLIYNVYEIINSKKSFIARYLKINEALGGGVVLPIEQALTPSFFCNVKQRFNLLLFLSFLPFHGRRFQCVWRALPLVSSISNISDSYYWTFLELGDNQYYRAVAQIDSIPIMSSHSDYSVQNRLSLALLRDVLRGETGQIKDRRRR